MSSLFKKKEKSLDQIKKTSTIQRDLFKIYKDKNGKMPDISKLDVKKRNYFRPIIILTTVILVLLAGVSWLGFLIFGTPKAYRGGYLDINVEKQTNVASGDLVNYKIKYENKTKGSLNDIVLFIMFPESFKFNNATPTPTNGSGSIWNLEDLAKDKYGEIEVSGNMIGEVGSLHKTEMTFSFEPENFSSSFKETSSFTQQITSSILELEILGPEQILPEKKIEYIIKYKNTSQQNLENVQLQILYPTNFVYQTAEPEPYQGEEEEVARKLNNIWRFEKLEKEAEGEIKIMGGYVSDEEDQKDFIVQIGFLDEEKTFSLQQEEKLTTQIVKPNLELDLIINGSNTDQPISFGETLTYLIAYKNDGDNILEDVSLQLVLESKIIDWDTIISSDTPDVNVKKQTIIWDKDSISKLKKLEPGDSGQIELSLKLMNFDEIDEEETIFETKSLAKANITKIQEIESGFEVLSNEILNIINTELTLNVMGRYFNDDNIAVGTGPLPLVVGQKTTLRIYWSINNSLNEVENAEVKTSLPQGVDFANKYLVNAGKLNYENTSKEVTWSLSKISSNTSFDDANIWFDVEIIPSSGQKGKIIVVTTSTQLTATDVETEDNITKTATAITSNLDDDPIANGKGIVVGIE
ncbi:hypothetical protein KKA15_04155 [Patescibacteria group bacterium]|nr:hypothetical protein [Patescibacteria group bacterium]